jgi:hypothetical protein
LHWVRGGLIDPPDPLIVYIKVNMDRSRELQWGR